MSDTIIYQRALRGMEDAVAATFAKGGHTPNPKAIAHIGLLLMILQLMSSIVTFMIGDTHGFFSTKRDKGLDSTALFAPLPTDLVIDAKSPANQRHEFWHSGTIEEQYWPLMIRCMLDADEGVWARPRPGQIIAMSMRFNTLGPVARRLLKITDDVIKRCAPHNLTLEAVRLRLHSFLRIPIDRHADSDLDPHLTIAKGLHNRMFAGSLDRMSAQHHAQFYEIEAEMIEKFGKEAALLVTAAAAKAGILNEQAYVNSQPAENLSGVSASPLQAEGDCGRILMTQLPLFQQLDDLMYHVNKLDEESMYNTILKEDNDTTTVDNIFFNVIDHEDEGEHGDKVDVYETE